MRSFSTLSIDHALPSGVLTSRTNVAPVPFSSSLITWYPSLAVWETSRGYRPDTKTEPEAWERFMRRAELTEATVVFTTQLLRG